VRYVDDFPVAPQYRRRPPERVKGADDVGATLGAFVNSFAVITEERDVETIATSPARGSGQTPAGSAMVFLVSVGGL